MIRVLRPELGAVIGGERFLTEIRVTAQLQHPHILALFDSGEADGFLYYVMPYVEGETVRQRLDRETQLGVDEAVKIATAVAEAFQYAHDHGVVHRDIKPENILLRDGRPILADFGIALAVSAAAGVRMTETGLSVGTPHYMSPEQAAAEKHITNRSDIYSLGAVLYEMLTGEPPHTGSTAQAVIARVINEKPRPVRASRDSVPIHVELAVEVALAKLPADRFGTAAEFADALQVARSIPVPASHIGGVGVGRSSARRWAAWAGAAGLVIGAGVALVMLPRLRAAPMPRVVRVAIPLPESQAFADAGGVPITFARDGSAIVYSGQGPHGSQLYYRRLDELDGTPLPGTDNGSFPTFSPSGDWVAFYATPTAAEGGTTASSTDWAIKKVSVHGGPAIDVVPLGHALMGEHDGMSWVSETTIITSGGSTGLFRVSANGGGVQRIALPDTARREAWFWPVVLPDDKNVLVGDSARLSAGAIELKMIRIADGRVTAIEAHGMRNPIGLVGGYLVFGRDGGTVGAAPFDPARTRTLSGTVPAGDVALSHSNGVQASLSAAGDLVYVKAADLSRISIVDAQGRAVSESPDARSFVSPRISPDGRRVVVVDHNYLWLYDIPSRVLQPLTTDGSASEPSWTPDGRRVAYTFRPGTGPTEARWAPADGSAPGERLIAMPTDVVRTVFSPDGRYAVVQVRDSVSRHDLYVVDLKGARLVRPLERTEFDETSPAVSPDGRWLAYVSDASGRDEIYVRPFPGGGAHAQLSANGGSDPRWEGDSRGIVYREGVQLMKLQLSMGPPVAVARRDSLFSLLGEPEVSNTSSSQRRDPDVSNYDLSPIRTLVTLRPERADAQLILVTNWISELKATLGRK